MRDGIALCAPADRTVANGMHGLVVFYCEKLMVQRIEDGRKVIDAQKRTGRINMVEVWSDRNTAPRRLAVIRSADASSANID